MKKAIILLALGAAAAGAGAYYFRPLSPAEVIEKNLRGLSEIKTIEYTDETTATMVSGKETWLAALSMTGSADYTDPDRIKQQLTLSVSITGTPLRNLAASLEFRSFGTEMYLRLVQAPRIEWFDLRPLENQWIQAEAKEAQTRLKRESRDQADVSLSPAELRKIRDELVLANPFTLLKEYPSVTLENIPTYHYRVRVDQRKLQDFLLKATEIIQRKPATRSQQGALEKQLANFGPLEAEMWIGKKDFRTYRVTFELKSLPDKGARLELATTLNARNYNQPVTIEMPVGARSLEAVVREVFGRKS